MIHSNTYALNLVWTQTGNAALFLSISTAQNNIKCEHINMTLPIIMQYSNKKFVTKATNGIDVVFSDKEGKILQLKK